MQNDATRALMQSFGYKPWRFSRATRHNFVIVKNPRTRAMLTAVSSQLFYRQYQHPVMGKIGVYAEPSGLSPLPNLRHLLGRVQARLTQNDLSFAGFSGQRSPIERIGAPLNIDMGQGRTRTLDALRLKGFLLRRLGETVVEYPKMRPYAGIGASLFGYHFNSDGVPAYVREAAVPTGTMLLGDAMSEFFWTFFLSEMYATVTPPFAFCEFEDRPLVGQSGARYRTGFIFHFDEGFGRLRTSEVLAKVLSDVSDPAARVRIIENVFAGIGLFLRVLHSEGYTHGVPHSDNFSFPADLSVLSGDLDVAIMRVHDLVQADVCRDAADPAFFARILNDLRFASKEASAARILTFQSNLDGIIAATRQEFLRNGYPIDEIDRIANATSGRLRTMKGLELGGHRPALHLFCAYFPFFADPGSSELVENFSRLNIPDAFSRALSVVGDPAAQAALSLEFNRGRVRMNASARYRQAIETVCAIGHYELQAMFLLARHLQIPLTSDQITGVISLGVRHNLLQLPHA